MPLIKVDPKKMFELFEDTMRCVVTVSQVGETGTKPAGNGFVIHRNEEFTVVAVHPSFEFEGVVNGEMINGPKAIVKFCDETKATDTTFIKLERSLNLIVAWIAPGFWQEAEYETLSEAQREDVMSIVSLLSRIMPFIGRVISPRATAVDARGNEIFGSRQRFTFHLPVAGHIDIVEKPSFPQKFERMKNQVLGGPIFNFNGRLVGFVDRCGHNFDFKFGVRVEELEAVVDQWLAGRKWEDAIGAHVDMLP